MQVEELLQLSQWFQVNIINNGILEKYQALSKKMNLNLRRQPGTALQPFSEEKEQLFSFLNNVTYDSLTFEQINLLEKMGVKELLSNEAIEYITSELNSSNLDLAAATLKISGFSERIKAVQQQLTNLFNLLSPYFASNTTDEVNTNEVLMRVYFQGGASINNVSDLKKLSNNWFEISRGIALAMNESPETFRIVGAKKGSIIIDMALVLGVATAVGKILLEALKVADRVLDIRKKVEEIRTLKLQNKKIEQELEQEAERAKSDGIIDIVKKTVDALNLQKDADGEKITAIEKSVTRLIEFTQNGGQVDFVNPINNESEEKEWIQLRNTVSEIRHLETRIKYLESKTGS